MRANRLQHSVVIGELEVMWPRRWTKMGVWGKMHLDTAKNGRPREQVGPIPPT